MVKKYKMNNKLRILGCVSPYSTYKDNCVGYLFEINNIRILLDCGPGICKQLKLPKDFQNLNIFISHFHKDHYLDIYAIAYASYVYNKIGFLKNRIKLYIPKTEKSDQEYNDYILLKKLKEHFFEIIEYDKNSFFLLDDSIKISFLKNYHSINAYSIGICFEKQKFVYSSDTGYSCKNELIIFSKNADYLLAESTYLIVDNQEDKFHLNTLEASTIAKEAGVKKLILTHFWPDHDKKLYLYEAKKIFDKTIVAKNNMIIKL